VGIYDLASQRKLFRKKLTIRLSLRRIVKSMMNPPVLLDERAGLITVGRRYADLGAAAPIRKCYHAVDF
jgi:hypothetical protein